jgi:hypothetical protein
MMILWMPKEIDGELKVSPELSTCHGQKDRPVTTTKMADYVAGWCFDRRRR